MKIEEINTIVIDKIDSYFNKETEFNNICINGEWGTGKTTLIENMKEKLKYDFIMFNMWKYEMFSENFSCIFFLDLLDKFNGNPKIGNKTLKIFKELIKYALDKTLKINITDIRKIFKDEETSTKKIYEDFLQNRDLISLFKVFFTKINKKIIIVFDDLDRCCDTTVIKLLSAIKNILFEIDTSNIFYVVSLNKNHINEILGNKNEKYTEKIFDLNINLSEIIEFDDSILNTKNNFINNYLNNKEYKNFRLVNKILKQVKINYPSENEFIEFLWFWKIFIEEVKPQIFLEIFRNISDFNFNKIRTMLDKTEDLITQRNQNFSMNTFINYIRNDNMVNTLNEKGYNPVNIMFFLKNLYIPIRVIYPFIKEFENFIINLEDIRVNDKNYLTTFGAQINIYIDIIKNIDNFYYEEISEILNLLNNNEDIYFLIDIFENWKKIIIK